MLVTCPTCHATYDIQDDIHAVLVCHRCQTEFTHEQSNPSSDDTPLDIPLQAVDTTYPMQAPSRKKARIWPWLTAVLLLIAAAGVQYNRDIWLQQPWGRQVLAQLHYPLHTQASDWKILRDESLRQWVSRQDGSKALVLSGYIQNQLPVAQQPPELEVQFFDAPGTAPVQTQTLPITQEPDLPRIHHAPYLPPEQDSTPIPAHGKRKFILVLEEVPKHSREISIRVSLQ